MHEIIFNDVTLRDGLQGIKKFISTEDKVNLANLIVDAGISNIELTSFVNPRLVPQMRDAFELSTHPLLKPANYSALVPNVRGLMQCSKTKIKEAVLFVSACPLHNRENLGKDISESLKNFDEIFKINTSLKIKAAISMAFGSPFTGKLPDNKNLFKIIEYFHQKGVKEITLCDTWGFIDSEIFSEQLEKIIKNFNNIFFSLHLHNLNGRGKKNFAISLNYGIRKFDTVFGLVGGCPFSMEAGVNLNIRDALKVLKDLKIKPSIKIEKLAHVEKFLYKITGGLS